MGSPVASVSAPHLSAGRPRLPRRAGRGTVQLTVLESSHEPINAMRFVPGPPDFAAEVRNKNDYRPAVELALAAKRAEYFEAGTLVVWEVDLEVALVRCYRPGAATPIVFGAGYEADAEPALPGWRLAIDWLLA